MSNSQQMKKGLSVRDLITTGILAALYMVCAMIGEAIFEQIRTIDKQRLKQYMGMMPDNIMARVDKALAISVALKKI